MRLRRIAIRHASLVVPEALEPNPFLRSVMLLEGSHEAPLIALSRTSVRFDQMCLHVVD